MRRLTLPELVGLRREQSRLTPEQQEIESETGGFLRYAGFEQFPVYTLKPHTPNTFERFYYRIRGLMSKW